MNEANTFFHSQHGCLKQVSALALTNMMVTTRPNTYMDLTTFILLKGYLYPLDRAID